MHRPSMLMKTSQAIHWLQRGLVSKGKSGQIGFGHPPADREHRPLAVRVAMAEAILGTCQPRVSARPPLRSVEQTILADVLRR